MKRIREHKKDKGDNMAICVMLSVMVINTEGHSVGIKMNEIQAWELIDKGLQDEGGLIEIHLKERKESLIIPVLKDDEWEYTVDWFTKNSINLAMEMNKTDIDESWKYEPKF